MGLQLLDLWGIIVDVTSKCTITPPSQTFTDDDIGYHNVSIDYYGTIITYQIRVRKGIDIVPFSTGTDKQIRDMMDAYYAGELDFNDIEGWDVGAERTISISAMEGITDTDESHVAQDITLVIMHKGGYDLATPINGITQSAFIIGMKSVLQSQYNFEYGSIEDVDSDVSGWEFTKRRTWCNDVFRNALSSDVKASFRQFKNPVTYKGNSTVSTIDDYFSLNSPYEVAGESTSWNKEGFQFDYYKTIENRNKNFNGSSSNTTYWLRTPIYNIKDYRWAAVLYQNTIPSYNYKTGARFGISIFGCF